MGSKENCGIRGSNDRAVDNCGRRPGVESNSSRRSTGGVEPGGAGRGGDSGCRFVRGVVELYSFGSCLQLARRGMGAIDTALLGPS